jgi:hypothetical protein
MEITKESLAIEFSELECREHKDDHRDVHELIAGYLMENFKMERNNEEKRREL